MTGNRLFCCALMVVIAIFAFRASARAAPSFTFRMEVGVPINFLPTSFNDPIWTDINSQYPSTEFIVVNPPGGVGTIPNRYLLGAFNDSWNTGVLNFGYVTSALGTRSFAAVKADVDLWYATYPNSLDGIYIDKVSAPNDCSTLAAYQAITNYIRALPTSPMLIINPGAAFDSCYLPLADVFVSFEGTASQYATWVPYGWETVSTATSLWHIIYSANPNNYATLEQQVRANNVANIYISTTASSGTFDRTNYDALNTIVAADNAAHSGRINPSSARALAKAPPPESDDFPTPSPVNGNSNAGIMTNAPTPAPTAPPTLQPTTQPTEQPTASSIGRNFAIGGPTLAPSGPNPEPVKFNPTEEPIPPFGRSPTELTMTPPTESVPTEVAPPTELMPVAIAPTNEPPVAEPEPAKVGGPTTAFPESPTDFVPTLPPASVPTAPPQAAATPSDEPTSEPGTPTAPTAAQPTRTLVVPGGSPSTGAPGQPGSTPDPTGTVPQQRGPKKDRQTQGSNSLSGVALIGMMVGVVVGLALIAALGGLFAYLAYAKAEETTVTAIEMV